ncbi:hypothetical protein K3495_g11824 [Podosphaera aphanis]|nr:hypothetical protein K3495_g11824 [Podosphaera aphanis]
MFLLHPRTFRVVDGRKSSAGLVTCTVSCKLVIGKHRESAKIFVTRLGQYPVILGYGWLKKHNPAINWQENLVKFNSAPCTKKCNNQLNPERNTIVQVKGLSPTSNQNTQLKSSQDSNIQAISPPPEIFSQLPDWLQHQTSGFSKSDSCILPPHRPIDHRIVLKEGSQSLFNKLYGMTREELTACHGTAFCPVMIYGHVDRGCEIDG